MSRLTRKDEYDYYAIHRDYGFHFTEMRKLGQLEGSEEGRKTQNEGGSGMNKIDKAMATIWAMALPIVLAFFVLFVVLWEYDIINPGITNEQSMVLLNTMAIVAAIFLLGWLVNLTWSIVALIREKLHFKYLEKHPEKCITNEQLAEDFERLAKALRESEDKRE